MALVLAVIPGSIDGMRITVHIFYRRVSSLYLLFSPETVTSVGEMNDLYGKTTFSKPIDDPVTGLSHATTLGRVILSKPK